MGSPACRRIVIGACLGLPRIHAAFWPVKRERSTQREAAVDMNACPVMCRASSESRNAISAAISAGSATWPSGVASAARVQTEALSALGPRSLRV